MEQLKSSDSNPNLFLCFHNNLLLQFTFNKRIKKFRIDTELNSIIQNYVFVFTSLANTIYRKQVNRKIKYTRIEFKNTKCQTLLHLKLMQFTEFSVCFHIRQFKSMQQFKSSYKILFVFT